MAEPRKAHVDQKSYSDDHLAGKSDSWQALFVELYQLDQCSDQEEQDHDVSDFHTESIDFLWATPFPAHTVSMSTDPECLVVAA